MKFAKILMLLTSNQPLIASVLWPGLAALYSCVLTSDHAVSYFGSDHELSNPTAVFECPFAKLSNPSTIFVVLFVTYAILENKGKTL